MHRGHDGTPTQHTTTTTKLLQNSFNDSEAAKYPPKPPKEYLNKDTVNVNSKRYYKQYIIFCVQ